MSDILREVDDIMKAERMNRLWQDHGKTILMMIGAIILGTALNSAWTSWKTHQAEAQTTAIIDAMKSDAPVKNLKELTATLKGSGRAFAALDSATLSLEKGQFADAIAFYTLIKDDKSAPQDLRDLAVVQLVAIQIDHADDVTADTLLQELSPVLNSKDSVWRLRALLNSAVIKAHKNKDFKGALEDLALLSVEPGLPPSMSAQISALQDVYQHRMEK